MGVRVYLLLSGEHRTLPLAEARAIAEAEGIPFKVLAELDQILIAETVAERYFPFLKLRASMIKSAGILAGIFNIGKGVTKELRKLLRDLPGEVGFYVFRRIKEYGSSLLTYERISQVVSEFGLKHLRKGRSTRGAGVLELIVTHNVLLTGFRNYVRDLSSLREREPHKRPVYRPGTLTPLMSRVFINLSRASVSRGHTFVDPFCGVGGFLLEACSMGMKRYVGSDINYDYVKGAATNLLHYGCLPEVVVADACRLPYSRADAIGTDPPYGRLTRVEGGIRDVVKLMECFLREAYGVLRKGGYLAFAQSREAIPYGVLKELEGFRVVERHYNWVHGSLTRDIVVVRKEW